MSDDLFLKFVFNEDLYLIDESKPYAENSNTEVSVVKEPVDVNQTQESGNKVLVIFDNPNDQQMEATQSAYLAKILSAVKLEMDQIDLLHIIDISTRNIDAYDHVISFSEKFAALSSEKYEIQKQGNTSSLLADDLTTISGSVDLRKKLWEALKVLFEV